MKNIFRKRTWLLAGLGLVLVLFVGTLGVGYGVVKAINFTANRIDSTRILGSAKGAALAEIGLVEEFVRQLASGWLQQQLRSSEVASLREGLACFDAVGGPHPKQMIEYVKSKVTDTAVLKRLDDISSTVIQDKKLSSGPTACANWILNG